MIKTWVGIRDSEGRLLGAKLMEASLSGSNKNIIEIQIRGRLKLATLDDRIGKGVNLFSARLEKGCTPPDLDLIFAGRCPSGHLAFKTLSNQIVRFGRDFILIPLSKLDYPDGLRKSGWKEILPGVFEKV